VAGSPGRAFWLGFFLGFGIEWLRGQLAASLLKQNFHFALGLFQMFLAIARELHPFLEQFHGLVERKVRALQLLHDFFQARQRMLEIGLLRGLWFFRRCWIHGGHFSLSLALGTKKSRSLTEFDTQHSNARTRNETTALCAGRFPSRLLGTAAEFSIYALRTKRASNDVRVIPLPLRC